MSIGLRECKMPHFHIEVSLSVTKIMPAINTYHQRDRPCCSKQLTRVVYKSFPDQGGRIFRGYKQHPPVGGSTEHVR